MNKVIDVGDIKKEDKGIYQRALLTGLRANIWTQWIVVLLSGATLFSVLVRSIIYRGVFFMLLSLVCLMSLNRWEKKLGDLENLD